MTAIRSAPATTTIRMMPIGFLLMLFQLLPVPGGAHVSRAEIKTTVQQGQVVYTSRPARKPGTETVSRERRRRPMERMPASYARLVSEISSRYGFDPELIAAVISVESAFDASAISPKGARGLMQLMPATAREYGVKEIHDPRQNIEGGVAYLSDLRRRYSGNMKLALAAYNAGPTAVERASGVPDFRETRDYIVKIEKRYGPLSIEAERAERGWTPDGPRTISARRGEDGELVWTNRRGRRSR